MKHSLLSRVSLFCVSAFAVAASAVTANAAVNDLGTMVPGVTYSYPGYQEVTGEYTPSVTGPVKLLFTGNPIPLYNTVAHEDEDEVYGEHSFTGDGGQMVTYASLEGGKTYGFWSGFTMMAGSVTILEGATDISIKYTNPGTENTFSVSNNYTIDVVFNIPVSVGTAYVIANGQSKRVSNSVYGGTVSANVYEAVMSLYNDGTLKEGDDLVLRLMQVADKNDKDNVYGTNGKCEITFKVAAKPAELTATVGYNRSSSANPLLSYYLPGDEAGVMKLIFDKDLDLTKNPIAKLQYGNPDNLELGIYQETISGIVDGNIVSFDFTNKLRRTNDMLPGADASQLPSAMYVAYTNIYTPDGQQAYTGMQSNPNSFSASYSIQNLLYTIAADFTPMRGTALKPGANVEIWVMNGAYLEFDNIRIDYVEGGQPATVIIPMEDVTVSQDADSSTGLDMLYNFKAPEFAADPDSEIKMYLNNVKCSDGLDHTADVVGNFKSATSGLETIDATAVSGDVYDITGKLVLRNATRSQLNSLDKGIYIFNGKKIAIK